MATAVGAALPGSAATDNGETAIGSHRAVETLSAEHMLRRSLEQLQIDERAILKHTQSVARREIARLGGAA